MELERTSEAKLIETLEIYFFFPKYKIGYFSVFREQRIAAYFFLFLFSVKSTTVTLVEKWVFAEKLPVFRFFSKTKRFQTKLFFLKNDNPDHLYKNR